MCETKQLVTYVPIHVSKKIDSIIEQKNKKLDKGDVKLSKSQVILEIIQKGLKNYPQ